MCSFLSMEMAEKIGMAAAMVNGVKTYEDTLNEQVKETTSKAKSLGVEAGLKGSEARQDVQGFKCPIMLRKTALEELYAKMSDCSKCELRKDRSRVVPGKGNPDKGIMVIGEAPGSVEEKQGEPFVGSAGKFLTELLSDAGLHRRDVFITNVVKCRPPRNRAPRTNEITSCSRYLDKEIEIICPKLIVTLGRFSSAYIFGKADLTFKGITEEHGKIRSAVLIGHRLKIFPSYHPAAALYSQEYRKILVKDFMLLGKILRKGKA